MTRDPAPASFNMAHYVLHAGEQRPDKTALRVLGPDGAEDWSFAQLCGAVLGTASGLLAAGLGAGDRVLLRLGNSPDFPIAFLACIAVGIIPVPTASQLTEAEITALAMSLRPDAVIAANGVPLPRYPAQVLAGDTIRGFYTLPPAQVAMGDPNRPAYIIYTSGTSGDPRGVVHAHRAIWARRMMWDGWYGLRANDRMFHAGAFNWTYTLGTGLMDPWTRGATALIGAAHTATSQLGYLMRENDVTIFAAAPGVYRQLLRSEIPDLPKLRHGLSAGEKLPESIRTAWQAATGTPIFEAFGMSECSTFISACPDMPAEAGTVGRPQPGRQIALLDDTGTPATCGQIAIHRSDPGLMLGYLDAPGDTCARYHGDWFMSGDMGTRTAQGHIRYDGRVDDMMNAGGYRVSPIEVEAALNAHPDIEDAAAVELAVKSDASVIAAFYTGPNVLNEDELCNHCATRLARYKTPRLFIHCDALPRGANNKLLRRKLRQDWERQHGQT